MDLNTILIILGILALIGLVAHGIWSNRREKSQYFDNENAFHRNPQSTGRPSAQASQPMTPNFAQPAKETEQIRQTYQEPQVRQMSSSPEQQTRPTAQAMPENRAEFNPNTVQPEQQPLDFNAAENIKITLPNTETRAGGAEPIRYEYHAEEERSAPLEQTFNQPVYTEDRAVPDMQVSLRQPAPESPISQPTLQQPVNDAPAYQHSQPAPAEPTDFIMLYVVAPENRQFHGPSLAQALDNLGFIFGQGNIYHRHLDLTVASPAIFSVANINQPGTFNPHGMQDFSTVGVALFMQLPVAGNPRANLKMMIQAAKNLASQLGGFVLTEQQEEFDVMAEAAYLARV
ncbi:cell division protein ZipA [Actinobacillus succinogenes]|uniref:Cell division protein ZipA n=1 Tax=Actinobacillus succinogenes (strain ATCC 55618 / DSM 22257 / CCUG 43843 / 130Z) TaxID=339671 RepID=ZIPA_ACTSZ|nr:cell division protein ZipA [Actinobacillus succinogenes]A6VR17.1 RecName: Full=Cell division protein ZipA [Actinobacillus succinogenes 130Z]ABR75414.1 cell division protein ZipA [Actinobacillus succinogenes 130Z]PHI40199.1 cell division protein ZipA [Actinobacillus succinogenes]